MFLLVTGPRGAGKTSFCRELLTRLGHLPDQEVPFGALAFLSDRLSPAGAREAGYDLTVLSYRSERVRKNAFRWIETDRRSLPLLRSRDALPEGEGPSVGPWRFSESTFAEAIALFEREAPRLRSGDLLVIDEIGPLELRLQEGFAPLLERVSLLPRVVVVVRPSLVANLKTRLAGGPDGDTRTMILDLRPGAHREPESYRTILEHSAGFLTG